MSRSYDYHSSSFTAAEEHIERLNRIERMPSMIANTSYFPNVHEVFNNTHQNKNPNKNDQERHKKVQFVEDEKKKTGDEKGEVVEEKTIDMEADGFIRQKHKGFELCKWDTFKMY